MYMRICDMHMIVCACVNVRVSERISDCGCVITSVCVCAYVLEYYCVLECVLRDGETANS